MQPDDRPASFASSQNQNRRQVKFNYNMRNNTNSLNEQKCELEKIPSLKNWQQRPIKKPFFRDKSNKNNDSATINVEDDSSDLDVSPLNIVPGNLKSVAEIPKHKVQKTMSKKEDSLFVHPLNLPISTTPTNLNQHQKRTFNRYSSMESPNKLQAQAQTLHEITINHHQNQNKSECKEIMSTNFISGNNASSSNIPSLPSPPSLVSDREIDYKKNWERSKERDKEKERNVGDLGGSLYDILREIRKISENKKESRSMEIEIELDECPCEAKERKHYLKETSSKIFSEIISIGFNLHYTQHLEFEKVKAYICENILSNLCRLTSIIKLTTKDLQILDEHIQEELLPFLNLNYPRSEEKLSNLQILTKVDEKDIFNENKFDIVYNSRINMGTKNKEINAEIMSIINYAIKLPDEKIDRESLGPITLYDMFAEDMQLILSRLEKRNLVDKLHKLKRPDRLAIRDKILIKNSDFPTTVELAQIIDQHILEHPLENEPFHRSLSQETNVREKEEQEYKEKVQSYTKFKMGRKIENVLPYTQEEIEEGVLLIKSTSVARVLMKWVESLETEFTDVVKNTYARDEPFRLSNGEETYLLSQENEIDKLCKFYERSSKVIKEKQEILKANTRQLFLEALKSSDQEKFKSYRTFSSPNEAKVGHICTLLEKCRESHISSYLNLLIGEIKSIEQEYEALINVKDTSLSARPSLVTLKLGDLIRCQITSQKKEILSLYSYICLICKCDSQRFELVRVKDRTRTTNKDILINIFYQQKIMIEIQLAVKNESAFINCSDKFSHFLYEMMRAFLGPINEMCSIWSQNSPKSPFYIEKFMQINVPSKNILDYQCKDDSEHEYEEERRGFKLPFWCSYCSVLYYNDSIDRTLCRKCGGYRCGICEIKNNEDRSVEDYIKSSYDGLEAKAAPGIGKLFYSLDIGTSHQHVKAMIKMEINGRLDIFSMKLDPEIESMSRWDKMPKITNIKREYEINKGKCKINLEKQIFDQSHIILGFKNTTKENKEFENKIQIEILMQIIRKYYLPSRIQTIAKKSQRFMRLSLITVPSLEDSQKGELISEILEDKNNEGVFKNIEKLNLNENGLYEVNIANKMPMIRIIALCSNLIESISLEGFPNLTSLDLSNNKIKSLKDVLYLNECRALKKIFMDDNKITSFLDLTANLEKLTTLSLKNNLITVLKIPKLISLECLNLNGNKINKVENIENILGIIELKLKGNVEICSLSVEYLKKLKQLRKLNLSHTNLKKTLDQSKAEQEEYRESPKSLAVINSLTYLEELDLSSNFLMFVPQLSNLLNLKELNLSDNHLTNLKKLSPFINLIWLNLRSNQISDLEGLRELKNLKWVDLSENEITSECLPEIGELSSIQEIDISENELDAMEGIGNLKSLFEFCFRSHPIKSLKGIEKLVSLEHLDARENQLENLEGIESLHMLLVLKLSGNSLKSVKEIKDIQTIKILDLSNMMISDLSQESIPRLKNLQELYLNKNNIKSLKGIEKFESLKKLSIKINKVDSFEEIENLKFLSHFSFSLNPRQEFDVFSRDSPPLETIKIQKDEFQEPTPQQQRTLTSLILTGCNVKYES